MKKRANILLALGLSSALCFSLASVIQTNAGAEGEGTFSLDGELEESYDVGERLNLPKGTFTVDGKNYEAVTTLYNPDGTVTAADSVTLKTEGRYTLEYTCTQTGQAEEYTFTVDKDLIEFDGEGLIKSSSVYGKDESVYDTGLTGLNVELYANETMNFNQVIDLNDFAAGESIFKMYVIPETLGYYNARTLKFRFTDIYDPDNYVDVYASAMQVAEPENETNVTKFNTTYLLGGANGQVPTGIEWRNTDGTLYTVHQANLFGFLAPVSPYGYKNKQENVGKEYLELGFDLNEKTVTSTSSEGKSNVVVDLDAEYMNTKWKGFTTGEVRLSVTAREYRTNKIPYRMIFTEIGGAELKGTEDKEGPEITVDFGEYEENNLPEAFKGEEYPVFDFTAYDYFTEVKSTSVKVFYDYNSSARKEVTIKNGKFVPDRTGQYTIEYTATDYYGNENKKTVEILSVLPKKPALDISSERVTEVSAGDTVQIADVSASGGSGELKVTVVAKNGEHEAEITDGKFTADYAGEYTITYTAADFLGNTAEEEYKVTVKDDKKPEILDDARLPKYLLEGFEYKVPVPTGLSYGAGTQKTNVTVRITDGNGTTECTTGRHTFKADQNGKAEIKYIVTDKNGTTEKSYTLPVLTVKNRTGYDLSKYFYSDTVTAEARQNDILLSAASGTKEQTVEFVNAVVTDGLNLGVKVNSAENNFSSFSIYLTDAENENISIRLQFVKGADAGSDSYMIYNGDDKLLIDPSFYNDEEIALTYSESDRNIHIVNAAAKITETVSGETFEGFPGKKVYVRFVFEEVSGAASISVSKINSQLMSNYSGDSVKPMVYIFGEYAKKYSLNDTIPVLNALAGDVIDPSPDITVTLTDHNGEIVTSVDGVRLENVSAEEVLYFKAEKYGNYLLTYTATDEAGKTTTYYRAINVEDIVPPEIQVNGEIAETVKTGSDVAVPFASVTDNLDEAPMLLRILVLPDGSQTILSETADAFRAVYSGVYKLRYIAWDSEGNFSMTEFTVTAE
jgi:secreted glycosyl hydrolase, family 16